MSYIDRMIDMIYYGPQVIGENCKIRLSEKSDIYGAIARKIISIWYSWI